MSTFQASRLFNLKYEIYRHQVTGLVMECSRGPYSLPQRIAKYVDMISGLVGFPDLSIPKTHLKRPSTQSSDQTIDPVVIRTRYNVSNVICTNPNSSHAVAEFEAEYFSPTDLQTFWNKFVPFAPYRPVDQIVGTNSPLLPGPEATLDIQYIMGVAPNATTWFYGMKGFNFWDDLANWASLLNNESGIPWVHSISYGAQGDDPNQAYQVRLDVEFQKLGVRGVSIIFASGDSGSGCENHLTDFCACNFNPSFPATCPHVTSVGATRFLSGNSGPEGAVYEFKSGGGFSVSDFSIPSFQDAAVEEYLNSNISFPNPCSYNSTGRSTPDVSALGDVYFQIIEFGIELSIGGTSAASPTFAAIITLLNDLRFNSGKSSLGWLNPFIYQTASNNPNAFFDVTIGDNEVTGCCTIGSDQSGFLCTKGYDPVTGVGTPNFEALASVVLSL